MEDPTFNKESLGRPAPVEKYHFVGAAYSVGKTLSPIHKNIAEKPPILTDISATAQVTYSELKDFKRSLI